ncbi:hypothetical protein [Vannielia litorea]|uniref:hypothetical protein n=1 Tax=Vannielia litorea TaxID=1217970 RepID=UPI001BCFC8A1|nr:hypothetical protein [Vannielia litorea]MBS8225579.1 hypothetical protein [Vannielia litorea]
MPFPYEFVGRYTSGHDLLVPRRDGAAVGVSENAFDDITVAIQPTPGAPAMATRQFRLLGYWTRRVTIAPLVNRIITGPMSGCYIMAFDRGGVTHVAHVGTTTIPGDSLAVKNEWRNFIAQPGITNVRGYKPTTTLAPADVVVPPERQGWNTFARVYTVIEPTGAIWCIGFVNQPDEMTGGNGQAFYCAEVAPVPGWRPWAAIELDAQWQ